MNPPATGVGPDGRRSAPKRLAFMAFRTRDMDKWSPLQTGTNYRFADLSRCSLAAALTSRVGCATSRVNHPSSRLNRETWQLRENPGAWRCGSARRPRRQLAGAHSCRTRGCRRRADDGSGGDSCVADAEQSLPQEGNPRAVFKSCSARATPKGTSAIITETGAPGPRQEPGGAAEASPSLAIRRRDWTTRPVADSRCGRWRVGRAGRGCSSGRARRHPQ